MHAFEEEVSKAVVVEGAAHLCAAHLARKLLHHWRLVKSVRRKQDAAPTTSMVLDAAEQQRAEGRSLPEQGAVGEPRARMRVWL